MTVSPANVFPMILLYVLASAPFWFVPALRRSGLYFSVPVTDDFRASEAARRVARKYWIKLALWTLATLALGFSGIANANHSAILYNLLMSGALVLLCVSAGRAFVVARRELMPFAVVVPATRSASLTRADDRLPGGVLAAAGPFAILAGVALWLRLHWDQIPQRFPTHFDFSGQANRWSGKTWASVYGQLIAGEIVLAVILVTAVMILRASPAGTEWAARFRKTALRVQVGAMWIVSIGISFVSLHRVSGADTLPRWLLISFLLAAAAIGWPLIRMSMKPGSTTDGTPDNAWKLGIFYYNPGDPAIMVQRRFTVGYTLNFGNRMSWVVLVGIIVVLFSVRIVLRTNLR